MRRSCWHLLAEEPAAEELLALLAEEPAAEELLAPLAEEPAAEVSSGVGSGAPSAAPSGPLCSVTRLPLPPAAARIAPQPSEPTVACPSSLPHPAAPPPGRDGARRSGPAGCRSASRPGGGAARPVCPAHQGRTGRLTRTSSTSAGRAGPGRVPAVAGWPASVAGAGAESGPSATPVSAPSTATDAAASSTGRARRRTSVRSARCAPRSGADGRGGTRAAAGAVTAANMVDPPSSTAVGSRRIGVVTGTSRSRSSSPLGSVGDGAARSAQRRLALYGHRLAALGTPGGVPARPLAGVPGEDVVGERGDRLVGQVLLTHQSTASAGEPGSAGRRPGARCASAWRSSTRPRWMRERTVPTLMPSVAAISS